jgi:hypothetical protein
VHFIDRMVDEKYVTSYDGDVHSLTFSTLIFNQETYYRKSVCEFASSYMHIHIFDTMIMK